MQVPPAAMSPGGLRSGVFWGFFCLFCLYGAASVAYGGSQARNPIRATAAGLHHSSQQCRILNLLSEARDRTRNLMVPSQSRFHCATKGIPRSVFKYKRMCLDDIVIVCAAATVTTSGTSWPAGARAGVTSSVRGPCPSSSRPLRLPLAAWCRRREGSCPVL